MVFPLKNRSDHVRVSGKEINSVCDYNNNN